MRPTARTVDDYFAGLSADHRAALERLRRTIRSAVPDAEECISYGIPAFRHQGRILVWLGAATNHCSFFPGAHPIAEHAAELERYDTSKGTVRFAPDRPLPAALVKKLVKSRVAEQAAAKSTKKAAKKAGAKKKIVTKKRTVAKKKTVAKKRSR